jgi:hypothetical protein
VKGEYEVLILASVMILPIALISFVKESAGIWFEQMKVIKII